MGEILEYKLDEVSRYLHRGELLSCLLKININKENYTGREIKEIFEDLRDIEDIVENQIYRVQVDMMELKLVLYHKGEIELEVDIKNCDDHKLTNIIRNFMDKNEIEFLVTYLGNIIKK